MLIYLKKLYGVLTQDEKKALPKYISVLFFGCVSSIFGLGAVIPLIKFLVEPKYLYTFPVFNQLSHQATIILLTTVLIVAYALKNIVTFLLTQYQSQYLYQLVKSIQNRLYKRYLSLPYEHYVRSGKAEVIKKINNETNILASFVVAPAGMVLIESFSGFFVLVFIFFLSPLFTLSVGLGLSLGIYFFLKAIKARLDGFAKARTSAWSSMIATVLASLNGIKETKLYHCESKFAHLFESESEKLMMANSFQYAYAQAPRMVIEFVGLAVIMIVTAFFVVRGSSTKEIFVLLGGVGVAVAQLLPSLNRLTQALVQMKYGFPALDLIYNDITELSQDISEVKVEKLDFKKNIQVKKLSFSYVDKDTALADVNLIIPKGKKVALVGRTGAGKTTFVDVLMGLHNKNVDFLYVDGVNVSEWENGLLAYQKLFGYVPQSIALYDKTVSENIAFGCHPEEIDYDRVDRVLSAVNLNTVIEGLPNKRDTILGEDGATLSGGQKQRLGIARALYREPEILVMDEATAALDNETERTLVQMFDKLQSMTLITIAHRLSTIRHYDLIYLFSNGRVVASGNYEELLSRSDEFRNMVKASSYHKVELQGLDT